ncbi:ubiquilin-1 [Histomonas meleagridis]|uniref:ubiquilin-1 n=1 Tax=Histomonas meleagridis TaxID=135588 RepID=UPI00355A9A33|nr:ubiquilin-1 [Histomonas meleagridis]KAH0797585.1 ubiquilin-1 [Histomonas meleagridis]
MKLEIKDSSGITLFVEVPHGTAIYDIKNIIFEQLGVAPIYQNLFYDGKVLNDQDKVELYGIRNGSILYLAHEGPTDIRQTIESQLTEQLMNSPKYQDLIERMPHIFNEYEMDDLFHSNLEFFASQDSITELSRIADLNMNNCEVIPGGFNEIVQNFKEIEEADIDGLFQTPSENTTVIPENASCPSNAPLPFLFFSSSPDETDYPYSSNCFV